MKKLDLNQKKQINGAKGIGFWGGAIGGSLITQTALDGLRFVLQLLDRPNQASDHRTQPNYGSGRTYGYGNFLASHAIMQLSKYPSRATMRLGLPWE